MVRSPESYDFSLGSVKSGDVMGYELRREEWQVWRQYMMCGEGGGWDSLKWKCPGSWADAHTNVHGSKCRVVSGRMRWYYGDKNGEELRRNMLGKKKDVAV